jgi:hypothetical protein
MKPYLNITILAVLLVLLVFVVPFVGAFEISGTYTEEGQKWLNDHWGENITLGQLAKIAYAPEDFEKIKENVDPNLLKDVWSHPYYWGDRYPPKEITPGPAIFDANDQYVPDPTGELYAGIMDGRIVSIQSGTVTDTSGLTCNVSTWTSLHYCP